MSSLSLPAPNAMTAQDEKALSEMVERIYQFCRGNRGRVVGRPFVTWLMDLSRRSFAIRASAAAAPRQLLHWTYTTHVDARREPIAAQFEFRFAEGSESYFVAQPVSFKGLHLYVDGNEFERTFPPDVTEPVAEDEWDRWGRGLSADICVHYERVIYPHVIETLRKIGARQPGRALRIVDLGGGSGRLAEMICELLPDVGEVVVVDRSAALVEQARPRAAKHAGRLSVRRADVTAAGFVDELAPPPDVVVLSGVVAQQVMDHEQALALMRACHRVLPGGGFALVPSYSPALLTAREYEAMGFTVHNRTLNVIEEERGGRTLRTNDFYVLEKR
jgi:SAM-dependent methyltransferase